MTYRSRKVEAGHYAVVASDGTVVANIVLTGRPGVDNYPWEWYFTDTPHAPTAPRLLGTSDTKSAALDRVLTMLKEDA